MGEVEWNRTAAGCSNPKLNATESEPSTGAYGILSRQLYNLPGIAA